MAVTIFPAPSVTTPAIQPEQLVVRPSRQFAVSMPTTSFNYPLGRNSLFGNGLYRFRFYPSGTSQPTVTMHEINASFATVGSAVTLSDADSGNTVGFVERWYTVLGTEAGWNFNTNQAGYLVVEKIDIPDAGTKFSIATTVSTSGNITFDTAASCVLLGGGGSGATSAGNARGGGGGGSGYQARFSVSAGTYSLVCGAGGTAGGNGGTSSFSGNGVSQTANGGIAGVAGGGGGNGGSGGGGNPPVSGAAQGWQPGNGGSNGGNGGRSQNGGPDVFGLGSGVTLTNYFPALTAGNGGTHNGDFGGNGGGLYAGGAGGGNGTGNGGAATGIAGGGGGAGGTSGTAGAGAAGGLIYMRSL